MRKACGSIILILILALILPAYAQAPVQNLTASAFPTLGCAVSVPNTWQSSPAVINADIGRWIYKNSMADTIPIRLVLQMGDAKQTGLQKHADELAQRFEGNQSDTPLMLDGKSAIRLILSKSVSGYPQHEIIVSESGGQNYLLDFYAMAGEDLKTSIDAVVKNWKWLPFAPPADHLEFAGEPVSISNNAVVLRVPAIMRPIELGAKGASSFMVYDCRTKILAFVASVDVLPIQSEVSLLELRNGFGSLMRERLELKKEIAWTAKKTALPGYLSEPVVAPEKAKSAAEAKYSIFVRYGLVKLARGRVALLTFTMTGQTVEDRKKYDVALLQILDSVSNGPIKNETPASKEK